MLLAGYRKLLCIHLPEGIVATARRRAGLERACREMGIDPDTLLHHYLPAGESHHIDAAEIVLHHFNGAQPHDEIGRLSALHIINGDSNHDTIRVASPYLPRQSL